MPLTEPNKENSHTYLLMKISENTFLWWGIGLLGLVISAWIGARCFERISGALLKKIVYSMMLISGIVAII